MRHGIKVFVGALNGSIFDFAGSTYICQGAHEEGQAYHPRFFAYAIKILFTAAFVASIFDTSGILSSSRIRTTCPHLISGDQCRRMSDNFSKFLMKSYLNML